MHRKVKIVSLTVVMLILAGVVAVMTLDGARQRALLVAAVEARTGAELQIDGELSVSIYPSLSVSAESITFAIPRAGAAGQVRRLQFSLDAKSFAAIVRAAA